jgi:hypothetical protein
MAWYLVLVGYNGEHLRWCEGRYEEDAQINAFGCVYPRGVATVAKAPKNPKAMSHKAKVEMEDQLRRDHYRTVRKGWTRRLIGNLRYNELLPAKMTDEQIIDRLQDQSDIFDPTWEPWTKAETELQYQELALYTLIQIGVMEAPEGYEKPDWAPPNDAREPVLSKVEKEDKEEKKIEQRAVKFYAELQERLLVKLKEYRDEAEHQDGFGYWEQFADVDEAFRYVVRYWHCEIEGLEHDEAEGPYGRNE